MLICSIWFAELRLIVSDTSQLHGYTRFIYKGNNFIKVGNYKFLLKIHESDTIINFEGVQI